LVASSGVSSLPFPGVGDEREPGGVPGEQTLTIAGWDEGVPQMKLGEKATLDITSDYAYGNQEFPGLIPKNSNLIL
jgi:FKBP-type peptidyl-prolyl cis-trans isomerase